MTGRRWKRWPGVVIALLVAWALTACSSLPDSGAVHADTSAGSTDPEAAPYFRPPGPAAGASRAAIVRGFLTAMEANPFSVAAARSFLSSETADGWRPDGSTLVYQAARVSEANLGVTVRLTDAHALDQRGAWRAGPSRNRTLDFGLVRENGQWRISDPPDALIVGASYFDSQFVPFHLYFYDRPGRVLVPEVVYLPRGEQTATTLVRGLLRGPSPARAAALRSALPKTDFELGVVITESGTAEVPLGPEMLRLSPDELTRALHQLATTLREVDGVRRVRVTVKGSPVPLPDGRTELSVSEGSEYSATGLGASRELLAISQGRVLSVSGDAGTPIKGSFGKPGYLMRSLAMTRSGDQVAGISETGHKVYVAARVTGTPARTVFTRGEDLARPTYDLYGNLWLVDRTGRGAVFRVVRGRTVSSVVVPGATGSDVVAASVSPDGTRLAVAFGGVGAPRVAVSTIVRGEAGQVLRVTGSRSVTIGDVVPDLRLGPLVDIGWRTTSTLAILAGQTDGIAHVVHVMADGSPGQEYPITPDGFAGAVAALVVNSDPSLPTMLLDAKGGLHQLDASGTWTGTSISRVDAAAYVD